MIKSYLIRSMPLMIKGRGGKKPLLTIEEDMRMNIFSMLKAYWVNFPSLITIQIVYGANGLTVHCEELGMMH